MLSKDEERELARLEESLGDSAWRRLLRDLEGPVWRHRWKLRLLVPFAILVTVCGFVTGSNDVVDQGMLVTLLITGYWAIMFMRQGPTTPPGEEGRPPPRA